MKKLIQIAFLLLISIKCTYAQISIKKGGEELDYKSFNILYKTEEKNDVSTNTYFNTAHSGWRNLNSCKIQTSNKLQSIWLKIPYDSLLQKNINWVQIRDPHINLINVFIEKNGKAVKQFNITGDHQPFNSRYTLLSNYNYPIDQNNFNGSNLIIGSNIRHTKNILPVAFLTQQEYDNENQISNILKGFFLGLNFIILIYNLLLFLRIRQSIYLWYCVYLLNILLYFITEVDFAFQYVYPNLPQINDVLRIGLLSFSIIPFIMFFNRLLELKSNAAVFNKMNNSLATGFLCLFLTGVTAASFGDFYEQGLCLKVFQIVSPTIVFILWIETIILSFKKTRYALYSSVTLTIFILSYIIYALRENQIIGDNQISANIILIGFGVDIFIITIAIAERFYFYQRTSEALKIANSELEISIIKSINQFKINELNRISSMLHDSIGARLSALRLNLETAVLKEDTNNLPIEVKNGTKEISLLADEVRNISHNLSPLLLKNKGLKKSIEHLLNLAKKNNIDLQFEFIGNAMALDFSNQLLIFYVISELIQNTIKHSQASESILQIIIQKELISIYMEDNGIGCNQDEINEGLGIIQIKSLISNLKGSTSITSNPKEGYKISIEYIPVNYE